MIVEIGNLVDDYIRLVRAFRAAHAAGAISLPVTGNNHGAEYAAREPKIEAYRRLLMAGHVPVEAARLFREAVAARCKDVEG